MDKGVAEAVGVICDYLKTIYTIPIIKITNRVLSYFTAWTVSFAYFVFMIRDSATCS